MANEGNYKGIVVKFGGDTTQLGKALRDIDAQAKGVSADIKEIEKGLKVDPKNIDLTVQKIQRLGDGIQTASRRLEMLKAAQADARRAIEEGSDGAEQRYRDLQREITRTGNELERLRKQSKDAEEALKKDLSESVEKFAGQVKTAAVTVTALVTALGGIAFSSAKTADDFITLSKVTGISTEELQKFSYASSLIDVDVSTLRGSLQKLTRNMQSAKDGTGNAAEAFSALKVNIRDSNGQLRDNAEVFYEVIDALGQVENATERDAYAMNIFGRSAQDLNPLIIAGSQALKDYGEQAESMGIIFDQQTLDNMNVLNDKLDISKQQLKGASMIIGGELLDSFDSLFGGADRLLKLVQQARDDGTLAEIAEAAASAVEGFISVVSSAVKFIYEFRGAILSGAEALIAYKAAMSISNIVKALIGTIQFFTAATKTATAAQQGMNAAAAVNPYAVIAAAAVLAINAIGRFAAAQYEANAAYGEFFDSVEKELEKNSEAVRSYDQLKDKIEQNRQAREKAAADIEGEYYGYEKLVERLYELNEVQNKTTADKAEMAEIVQKLESGVDGLAIAFDKETGALSTQREELERAIEKTKELALAQAAVKNQEAIAADLSMAELDQNKLQREFDQISKEREAKAKELARKWGVDEANSVTDIIHELYTVKKRGNIENDDTGDITRDIQALENYNVQQAELGRRVSEAGEKIAELSKEYDLNAEMIEKNSKQLKEKELAERNAAKAAGKTAEVVKESADAIEEQTSAYDAANKKAAEYKAQVEDLITVYQNVSGGMHYTTGRINSLVEKYPELVNHIKRTSDGYRIEAEAVKELIDKKAELMLAEKREAEQAAKDAYDEAAKEYGRKRAAAVNVSDEIFNTSEAKKKLDEAKELYEEAKNVRIGFEMTVGDYQTNNFGAAESSSGVSKAADQWKAAAQAEVSEAEHLYKMGEISAAEYYKRLEDINRRYYEGRTEYLEEYRKLEETVYAGLKKQQEDQLSNMKTLLERINAVRDARRQLESAENQKMSVFSSAAGFHIEDDKAAIDKAADSLQSKTLELASLLQQKYGMNISMPDISGLDLSVLLPDLSGLRIPGGTASSRQVTVNYQAGDVYISGSADSDTVDRLRALMNSESRKFFEEYLTDYLDRADMDRQTGG